MTRRKRKLFYWVQVPGLWWCSMRRKWVPVELKFPKGGSNVRSFKTAKAAFRHAQGCVNLGYEPFVTQWRWHKGRRQARDYHNMVLGPKMFQHNRRRSRTTPTP